MSHKHRSKAQPVTRREVLRIVQAARDEILSAIVHSGPALTVPAGTRSVTITAHRERHLADVEKTADG